MRAVWILIAIALGHVLASDSTELDNSDLLAHHDMDQQYIEEPSLNSENLGDGEQLAVELPYPVYIEQVHIEAGKEYQKGTVAIEATRYSLSEEKQVPVTITLPCRARILSVKVRPKFYVTWYHTLFSYIDLSPARNAGAGKVDNGLPEV